MGFPSLADRLCDRQAPPILVDGATGTELEARGVATALPLWSAEALETAPEAVARIHRDYVAAGAELITANTFRTQRWTLAKRGLESRADEFTRRAVRLARDARPVWLAGSMAPLEDCYHPERVPPSSVLVREHLRHAQALAVAGVDVLLVETMNTVREAGAAAEAARETGLPWLMSFVTDREARLLSGETLDEALETVVTLGPLAVLVNCLPWNQLDASIDVLAGCGRAFGVYPNLGAPSAARERTAPIDPSAFAERAADWWRAGARLVGGCCGTTPAHVAEVRRRVRAPLRAP